MALEPLVDRVFIGRADHQLSTIRGFQCLDLRRQAGGDRDTESVGQFLSQLAIAPKRQPGKQRRAAEDDRVAIVLDQVRHGVFDPLQGPLKSSSTSCRTVPVVLSIMKPSGNIL